MFAIASCSGPGDAPAPVKGADLVSAVLDAALDHDVGRLCELDGTPLGDCAARYEADVLRERLPAGSTATVACSEDTERGSVVFVDVVLPDGDGYRGHVVFVRDRDGLHLLAPPTFWFGGRWAGFDPADGEATVREPAPEGAGGC